uniref:Predicted DNA binding protein, CopG/RHH family n=1 Tax=Candidatus Kentrum sp. FW TaxID=2126338 RepID=A0A450T6C9_9GAMM|nr:MAG: Predicted DNA binding protein, CopG/RHH family [Candidatus Kentron sp. FW]
MIVHHDADKGRKEILDAVESCQWRRIADFGERSVRYREIAATTSRQDKHVNIHMTERDFMHFRKAAKREGLSYQALIGSISHEYINGRLVEKPITLTFQINSANQ